MQIEAKCNICKTSLEVYIIEAIVGVPIQLEVKACSECTAWYRYTINTMKEELQEQNELIAVLNDNIDYLSDYHEEES